MSLAEQTARQRALKQHCENLADIVSKLTAADGDQHQSVELFSYALFCCAEALATAGEPPERVLELIARGHQHGAHKD